jgi:hypothetical protein
MAVTAPLGVSYTGQGTWTGEGNPMGPGFVVTGGNGGVAPKDYPFTDPTFQPTQSAGGNGGFQVQQYLQVAGVNPAQTYTLTMDERVPEPVVQETPAPKTKANGKTKDAK